MGAWLARIFRRRTARQTDAKAAVRNALQKAQRGKSRIRLESPQGLVAGTTVQKVAQDEMIVAQPRMSGMIYPLGDGDVLKLSFIEHSTHLTGQTKCLGRVKTNSSKGPVYVYRLTLPEMLHFEDRRGQPRNDIDPRVAPEVQITGGWLKVPLKGALADISSTGMRIHISGSTAGVEIGQELFLQFLMPEPAGLIDEVTEVLRLERDTASRMNAICVSFRRRVPHLEALLRLTTERVPMPLQQAQRKVA